MEKNKWRVKLSG